jgi:hypothetical protein
LGIDFLCVLSNDENLSEIMLTKLKDLILKRQTLNQNKCGTTVMFLMEQLNISQSEIKGLLNQLHSEKFIRVRQGINVKLIFLK